MSSGDQRLRVDASELVNSRQLDRAATVKVVIYLCASWSVIATWLSDNPRGLGILGLSHLSRGDREARPTKQCESAGRQHFMLEGHEETVKRDTQSTAIICSLCVHVRPPELSRVPPIGMEVLNHLPVTFHIRGSKEIVKQGWQPNAKALSVATLLLLLPVHHWTQTLVMGKDTPGGAS
ncbi:hypothetical protein JB92DRAFT_2837322 [Gautieria morchelliformis]|nr:hypothetical protein JB92DRAFT_2837322 [Gautieria morchelliformis]